MGKKDKIRRAELLGSLLLFTQVFFKLRTNKDYNIVEPVGREARQITICRELTKLFYGETKHLLINIQPGAGKSELMIHFVAWAMAHYPDCNFMYISHTVTLAEEHTHTIKQIMCMPEYVRLFGVKIRKDSSAKGHFKTEEGGQVIACGAKGNIVGINAGLPNLDRFSGMPIMDDMHKPDEVHSDTMRESVIRNYMETISPRPRGPNVPTCFIGQCLHQYDLAAYLKAGHDGNKWKQVVLKSIDEAGNNLCPDVITIEKLRNYQINNKYTFASQYQQDPQPAGGGIFDPDCLKVFSITPKILNTFITVDTAETSKTCNDATVFSLWGIYRIIQEGIETDLYGLHWLDCHQVWVEPKDLRDEFMQFYRAAMGLEVKPYLAAIEKKSTGVTLISILKEMQGLQILEIERTRESGSKTARFLNIQSYWSSKRVSITEAAPHRTLVTKHMADITTNDTHRYDDICDTLTDAVNLALIDKVIMTRHNALNPSDKIVATLARHHSRKMMAGNKAWHRK